jgi:hypothetical protein
MHMRVTATASSGSEQSGHATYAAAARWKPAISAPKLGYALATACGTNTAAAAAVQNLCGTQQFILAKLVVVHHTHT